MVEINKVNIDIQPEFFDEYRLYRIISSKKLWDAIDQLNQEDILASCGRKEDGETVLYVLSEKPRNTIRRTLEQSRIPYSVISESRDLPLKLLLNAFCWEHGYVSLGGRNFYVGATFFGRGKLKSIVDVPEVWGSRDNCISVRSVRFKKWNRFGKGPAYRVTSGGLCRTNEPAEKDCYVIGGLPGERAGALPFFSTSASRIERTRSIMIRRIVESINEMFDGLVHLTLESVEDVQHYETVNLSKCTDIVDKMIESRFADCGVCSDMADVYRHYDIREGSDYIIRKIKAKDAFEDKPEDDPYRRLYNVQHVTTDTVDSFKRKDKETGETYVDKALCRACLIELAIKRDILEGKDSFNIGNGEELCVISCDSDHFDYAYCRRDADGWLTFGKFTPLFGRPDFIPEEVFDVKENLVMVRGKDIIGIRQTEYTPLPNENASAQTREKKGAVRNRVDRNDLFGGIIDAHLYRYEGRLFYYSAVVGSGMKETVGKASYLMELVPYTNGHDAPDFSWIFNFIGVTYINAGNRFTTYPYLFKYLREWEAGQEETG